jgi:thioredoxin 1
VTAGKYGVRGVPTVMVFKNGERAAQHVGLTTKAKLKELVGG